MWSNQGSCTAVTRSRGQGKAACQQQTCRGERCNVGGGGCLHGTAREQQIAPGQQVRRDLEADCVVAHESAPVTEGCAIERQQRQSEGSGHAIGSDEVRGGCRTLAVAY